MNTNEKQDNKVELCPITDGTCPRDCGFPAHITIKRANKTEPEVCEGCECERDLI